jgi:aspartyl protease family protein
MKSLFIRVIIFSGCLLFAGVCIAGTQVNIVGLFSNKAVVIINGGKPKT